MSVFYLDLDAHIAASYYVDSDIPTGIIETAKILGTAHRIIDGHRISDFSNRAAVWKLPGEIDWVVPGVEDADDPMSEWARSGWAEYKWLFNHFNGLLKQYALRFGSRGEHPANRLIPVFTNAPNGLVERYVFTKPPCDFGDYTTLCTTENRVASFRMFYILTRQDVAKWRGSTPPHWWPVTRERKRAIRV